MRFSLAAIKDPNGARLFTGQLISQVCDKMMSVGLVWVMTSQASLTLVPWFLALGALPHLLFVKISGKLIPKFGLLKTVIFTDLFRGILFLLISSLSYFFPKVFEPHEIPILMVTLFLSNCASAFFNPAILSLPMSLSSDSDQSEEMVMNLTAMIDSCFSLANVLGPVMTIVLYPLLGLSGLFLINGLSYIFAGALEAKIKIKKDLTLPAVAVSDGLSSDRLIVFMLITFFFMNLALTPLIAFLPIFVKEIFGGKISILGAFESALGLGAVAGSMVLALFQVKIKTGVTTLLGASALSLLYFFFSQSQNLVLSELSLFLLGATLSVVNISLMTFFQTRPVAKDVPAVMSYVNLIGLGAMPFSMGILSAFMEKFSSGRMASACAVLLLALTGITALNKEFRNA